MKVFRTTDEAWRCHANRWSAHTGLAAAPAMAGWSRRAVAA